MYRIVLVTSNIYGKNNIKWPKNRFLFFCLRIIVFFGGGLRDGKLYVYGHQNFFMSFIEILSIKRYFPEKKKIHLWFSLNYVRKCNFQ